MNNEEHITYFAQTDARNKKVSFGIKAKDRTRHVYVIGKTGMGKSTLLENMAVQDIKNGEGLAFIDPHGKSADLLLEYIPEERVKDVIYFAPFDTDFPISFNVLESVDPDKRHLVVSGLMSTFKKIWEDAWSARMEYILTNTLLALLEYPGATLLGVNRMLAEKDFRKDVIDHVTDISVKNFWTKEFANYTERMAAEAVPAIQNKIGQFTANALIRNMIGQPNSSFDIRKMMDSKKIFIINLSKGKIGESNANLLGGMLITKIYLAAMSRADMPERVLRTMPNFYLFVDEFQSFANESFADILSEARKYKLNLTIAHQYIEQMEEEVRAAVFGNVGTMIIFRVGAYDAEVLEKEFAPTFTAEDIVNLGQYQIYLKLMIDGISSQPFSATNLPPIAQPEISRVAEVIASSREQFAHPRADVEATITKWHEPVRREAPQREPVRQEPANMKQEPTRPAPMRHEPTRSREPAKNEPTKSQSNQAPAQTQTSIPTQASIPTQTPVPTQSQNQAPASATARTPSPSPKTQPFKQALNDISTEASSLGKTPISLSALSKTAHPKNADPVKTADPKNAAQPFNPKFSPKFNSKIATPQNMNDLKNALASIIGTGPQAGSEKAAPKKEPVHKEPMHTETARIEKPQIHHEKTGNNSAEIYGSTPSSQKVPQEVPKDVLENILKI